jgi:hypothetical protein
MNATMKSTKDFVDRYGIEMEFEQLNGRDDIEFPGATHWLCRLTSTVIKHPPRSHHRELVVRYSMGSACETPPKVADVLDSLIADSDVIGKKFEEWASDLGYDVDSRKAEKIYHACAKQSYKLESFLTPDILYIAQTEYDRL